MAGVIAVVEDGLAFELRCSRQQDELAVHVVDEEIAAAVVKTNRAQCFNDQAAYFSSRAPTGFAGVDRLGDLKRIVDLQRDAFTQYGFGAAAAEFNGAQGIAHFRLEPGLGLGAQRLFDTGERGLGVAAALPRIKAGEGERQHQHDRQRASQVNSRYCFFVRDQLQDSSPLATGVAGC